MEEVYIALTREEPLRVNVAGEYKDFDSLQDFMDFVEELRKEGATVYVSRALQHMCGYSSRCLEPIETG